jgi:hypothetical protein
MNASQFFLDIQHTEKCEIPVWFISKNIKTKEELIILAKMIWNYMNNFKNSEENLYIVDKFINILFRYVADIDTCPDHCISHFGNEFIDLRNLFKSEVHSSSKPL